MQEATRDATQDWHKLLGLRLNIEGIRLGEWVRRFWLVPLQLILAFLVAGAMAIPMLYALGWSSLASSLFSVYHLVCAQVPSHSYYLFGYQLGLCARNLAIYSSLLVGSLLFGIFRHWVPPLKSWLWLLTMVPMALDGGTQLSGLRESSWLLRTLTGMIFGLGVCWFLLPRIEGAASLETPATLMIPTISTTAKAGIR